MINFSKFNIVIYDNFHLLFNRLFDEKELFSNFDQRTGFMNVIPSGIDVTFTTCPIPIGRMSNFFLKYAVKNTADMFVLVLSSSYIHFHELTQMVNDFPKIPIVCLINRSNEKENIEQWKENERGAFFRQYKAATKFETLKEETNEFDEESSTEYCFRTTTRQLNPNHDLYPISEMNTISTSIKVICPTARIYEVDLSGLGDFWDLDIDTPIKGTKNLEYAQQVFNEIGDLGRKYLSEGMIQDYVIEAKRLSFEEMKTRPIIRKKKKNFLSSEKKEKQKKNNNNSQGNSNWLIRLIGKSNNKKSSIVSV